MYQNVVALHATDRMLDKDADLTSGFILSLWLSTALGTGVLFTLARFLCRHVNRITTIVSLHTQIASIDPNMDVGTPVHMRRQCLFQHGVIVMVTTQCTTKKNDTLVRPCPGAWGPRGTGPDTFSSSAVRGRRGRRQDRGLCRSASRLRARAGTQGPADRGGQGVHRAAHRRDGSGLKAFARTASRALPGGPRRPR